MKFYLVENLYISLESYFRKEYIYGESQSKFMPCAISFVPCSIISISKTEKHIEKCQQVNKLLDLSALEVKTRLRLGVSRIKTDNGTFYKGFMKLEDGMLKYLHGLSSMARIQVEYLKTEQETDQENVLYKVTTADLSLQNDRDGFWEDTNVDFPLKGFENPGENFSGFFTVTVTLPDEILLDKRRNPEVQQNEVVPETIPLNQKILEQELLSDVTIITADGTEMKAHKVFLASQTTVFEYMFSVEMINNQEGKISIPELQEKSVRAFLRYLYYEDDSMNSRDMELVFDIYNAAHKYRVEKLKTLMHNVIMQKPNEGWFNLETSVKLYIFAESMTPANNNLKMKMVEILKSYAPKLETSQEYRNLRERKPDVAWELKRLVFPSL